MAVHACCAQAQAPCCGMAVQIAAAGLVLLVLVLACLDSPRPKGEPGPLPQLLAPCTSYRVLSLKAAGSTTIL